MLWRGSIHKLLLLTSLSTILVGDWWEKAPLIIATNDSQKAQSLNARGVLCGIADDPCWGIYAQRLRIADFGNKAREFRNVGVRTLIWIEGFGTAESYIAQLKKDERGEWIKHHRDPTLTKVFLNHWGWQLYDGTGEIRWVGIQDYYNDEDHARPYTLSHPIYHSPIAWYPDGTPAIGYVGSSDDPRNARVYDAGCAKDILGRVSFEYEYNPIVNKILTDEGRPKCPLTGLIKTERGYAGVITAGKDSACPFWIDYARASIRQALDAGVDGVWVDNFSPWDSFGDCPVRKAFGEWSIAGFRGFLKKKFKKEKLLELGIRDVDFFDVREYLKNKCREWGGNPEVLDDPSWRDPRWKDDPIWRAYLIYKRQQGTEALSNIYKEIKGEAKRKGKSDFLVMGNDIPFFSLGWVRGDLDMVSSELTWGWHITTGPRGIMPPPLGSFVPVYKLAREHARSRWVNVWMYVPPHEKGKPNIARVLYYQGLANHTLPMLHYEGDFPTAGNPEVDEEFFSFVNNILPKIERREPIEEVGLYYSSSSQLIEMLPGGLRDHSHQPHSFSFWGWGTALTFLHIPWRALPEWKLNIKELSKLKVLIIPSAEVFPSEDVPLLEKWVKGGGYLIVAGDSGRRSGEKGFFEVCSPSTLSSLFGGVEGNPRNLGRGKVLYLSDDPGIPFYKEDKLRVEMLEIFKNVLNSLWGEHIPFSLVAKDVPWYVGMTLYHCEDKLYVDINNTNIELEKDEIIPASNLIFRLRLPKYMQGKKLSLRTFSPNPVRSGFRCINKQEVEIALAPIPLYACLILYSR